MNTKLDTIYAEISAGELVDKITILQIKKEKITTNWGAELIGRGIGGGKQKGSVQDAHEAIRPTNPTVEIPKGLDDSQTRLYRLIWSRFIASQMCESEWTSMKVKAKLDGKSFILIRSASDTGALYGSVSSKDIKDMPEPVLNHIVS